LETYLDILFEVAPVNTRKRVILLYEVGTRCKKLRPSYAPLLWNDSLNKNIEICTQYYENSLRPYYPKGFEHIIKDTISPLLYMESFENYMYFVNMMLTRNISWSTCVHLIDCSIRSIDARSVAFHERVSYLDAALEFEISIITKMNSITQTERVHLIQLAKDLFAHLLRLFNNISSEGLKSVETRNELLKDELLAVVYHPDNFQRLIPVESLLI
jgi:hypothetical protein